MLKEEILRLSEICRNFNKEPSTVHVTAPNDQMRVSYIRLEEKYQLLEKKYNEDVNAVK